MLDSDLADQLLTSPCLWGQSVRSAFITTPSFQRGVSKINPARDGKGFCIWQSSEIFAHRGLRCSPSGQAGDNGADPKRMRRTRRRAKKASARSTGNRKGRPQPAPAVQAERQVRKARKVGRAAARRTPAKRRGKINHSLAIIAERSE
jgi:hypothetical protein